MANPFGDFWHPLGEVAGNQDLLGQRGQSGGEEQSEEPALSPGQRGFLAFRMNAPDQPPGRRPVLAVSNLWFHANPFATSNPGDERLNEGQHATEISLRAKREPPNQTTLQRLQTRAFLHTLHPRILGLPSSGYAGVGIQSSRKWDSWKQGRVPQ